MVDGIQTDLSNGTDGLGALKTLIDAVNTDLSNGTDGLGALKTLIDTVNTDLSNGTDGLGALKTLIDTMQGNVTNILTDTGTTLPATLATIAAYIDTEVQAIIDDLANGTDGLGALKTLIDTMQGNVTNILTDTGTTLPATLATIASYIDTEVQAIIDDLANGTDGLGALKALIDGLNDISAADVNAQCDAAIETYGLDHLVSAAVIGADIADDSIIAFLASKSGTADWDSYDNTTDSLEAISDSGGGGPTATQIVDEWETQSQADPTGFHVNVKEVNGTSQTANDHGADFATLLTNVAAILTDTGTTLPATLATIAAYIDTEVQAIIDDLANGTDGLGALKTLIDAVNTDLSNGTDGLGALKALIDAVGVDAARLTAVRAAVLTDLIDGNRLDLLIDAIKLVTDAQARAADTIMDGAAVSGTLSTTEMTTGLTVTVADQYNGRQLIFADDTTTAALRGQATAISATTVSGSKLGFTALTTAPVVGDTFSIV